MNVSMYVLTNDKMFTVRWYMFFSSLIDTFNEPNNFGRGITTYYKENVWQRKV